MEDRTPFVLYLNQELKKQLIKEAKENGLTLNAYIRLILMKRKKVK